MALVPGAWALFKAGRFREYHELIAEFADREFVEGADAVALAQASMAGAANLTKRGPPLTSPSASLSQILRTLA